MAQRVLDFTDGYSSSSAPTSANTTSITSVTTTYSIVSTDSYVLCNGTFTVTFPAVASNTGRILTIVNVGTGVITEDGNGAETLNNAATQTLDNKYTAHTWLCDGTQWMQIA